MVFSAILMASTALGRVHLKHDPRSLTFSHHMDPELMGGPCDCSWTKQWPTACQHDDGSYCWSYCCKGPSPSPSPQPVGPPTPVGPSKPVNLVQEYYRTDLGAGKNLTRALANGFTRQGSMRYHSQEKLNLLGGGLTFDVDLSRVKQYVNANLYLVIPGTLDSGSHFYCDNSATYVGKGNACIELDIMESNGNILAASTMHTHIGTNSGCDTWGCRGIVYLNGDVNGNSKFQVDVEVSNDGNITVKYCQNGKCQYAFNNESGFDSAAKQAIVDGMRNHGAIVMSSMWTGWVPPNTSQTGDLSGSVYSLSNLMYRGKSMGPSV